MAANGPFPHSMQEVAGSIPVASTGKALVKANL
jgi:hypothetical protein